MCSANAVSNTVQTVSRVASGVLTLGGSEIARNNLSSSNPINKVLQAPGAILTGGNLIPKAAVGLGLVKPSVPAAPGATPAPDPTSVDPINGPQPGAAPPSTILSADPTELAAQLRRKRLSTLQGGVGSTIFAGGSTQAAPNLLAPAAMAAGMKTALGS